MKSEKLPCIVRIHFPLAKRLVLLLQAQKLSKKYNIRILAIKITSMATLYKLKCLIAAMNSYLIWSRLGEGRFDRLPTCSFILLSRKLVNPNLFPVNIGCRRGYRDALKTLIARNDVSSLLSYNCNLIFNQYT